MHGMWGATILIPWYVIGYAKISPVPHGLNNYDIYGIFFHEESAINLKYGAGQYTISKERFYVSHLVRSVAKKTMVKKSK